MDPEFTGQNPIVAAASRIRARRDLEGAIDSATGDAKGRPFEDAEAALRLFAEHLNTGARRLNSILGRDGVKVLTFERPLRLRLRFRDKRVAVDLDDIHQLVRIAGAGLDGEYQFNPGSEIPALIDVSKISTEAGYGEAITASALLKKLTEGTELQRPPHLDSPGPLSF